MRFGVKVHIEHCIVLYRENSYYQHLKKFWPDFDQTCYICMIVMTRAFIVVQIDGGGGGWGGGGLDHLWATKQHVKFGQTSNVFLLH